MAAVKIICKDAISGQFISGASFKLFYSPQNKTSKRGQKQCGVIENASSCFELEGLVDGKYYLEETKSPTFSVEVEDENCDLYDKHQTYVNPGKVLFVVDGEDTTIEIEYQPDKVTYSKTTSNKTGKDKKKLQFQNWLSLYDRSHELNEHEFKSLSIQIGAVALFVQILYFFFFVKAINPLLNLSILSRVILIVGVLLLILLVAYKQLDKVSRPRNRVLDKIPEPIKSGENAGLYGTNEIVTDPKTVKKILSTTNKLNEIEIDDPGVYCGYYQCKTWQRLWNLVANFVNKKTKYNVRKYSGAYCYIPDDCHAIIYGDTRAGKTRRVLLSTIHLISRGKTESFIIFDSKRELLALTSSKLKKAGYDIKVYDFEHPENSTRHNPLYVAINFVKEGKMNGAMQEVSERVNALVDPKFLSGENKYFYEGAMNLIKAVTLAILSDNECPVDQKTFTTVSRMLEEQVTKQPVNPAKPNGARFCPFEEYIGVKFPLDHVVHMAYAPLRQVEDRHVLNFISTAQGLLSIFRDPMIEDMTKITENPFSNIAKKKQAVFIVAPSHKQAYKSLATLFLDQMYSEIRSEANEDTIVNGVHQVGRTTRRVNFICEEILSINPWEKLMDALNEGAGLGMRFFLIIQNQQLFNQKYGREEAEGIKPNCATQMLITTGDTEATVKHWETQLGTMTVESVSKVVSGSRLTPFKKNTSITRSACKRATLEKAEIEGWDANCGILIKTKLHENILNVPLPDVSCTPTEDFFGLGSKQDNLEKASKILSKSFRDSKTYTFSKTNWLPGIPNALDIKYSDQEIKKYLKAQTQKYVNAFYDRISAQKENDTAQSAVVFNKKSGEIVQYQNLKDLNNDLWAMKYSAKAGWEVKKFTKAMEMQKFVNEFSSLNSSKKQHSLF